MMGGESGAGTQPIMLTTANPLNISRIHLCLMADAIPSFCNLNTPERFLRFVAYIHDAKTVPMVPIWL